MPFRTFPPRLASAMQVVLAGMLFTACSLQAPPPAPTSLPPGVLKTEIQQTVSALRSETAAAAPASTATTEVLTTSTVAASQAAGAPETATLAPPPPAPLSPGLPQAIPNSLIEILRPGPLSRVVSPIRLHVVLKPGAGGIVQFELRGEDQRILSRQIQPLQFINREGYATLYTDLPFEIPGTAEAAWLVFSVVDEYQRVTTVNSVPLILLSIGQADILIPPHQQAPIVILEPRPLTLIQGGTLTVAGLAAPGDEQYTMLQLITPEGKVVGKRVTNAVAAPGESPGRFTADVPYEVQAATPALLTVFQGAGSLSNIVYLTSVEVLLGP